MFKLLCVEFLAQFHAEVPPDLVRLALTFQTPGNGPAQVRRYTLRLQGWNAAEELVQLTEDVRINLAPDGRTPWDPRDRSLQAAVAPWRALVKAYLEQQGYTVLGGFYAVPEYLKALDGHFECATWERAGDQWTVKPAQEEPCTT
jgi:hypothetical protein